MAGSKLENLFYKGTYSEVLNRSVDASTWKQVHEDIPFVVGALSFTGRLEEAELLIKKIQKHKKSLIIARFFLGIGLTRLSQYERAQKIFNDNFKLKNKTSDIELFFIYQGLAFYEFFSGQLDAAEKSSKLAFEYANNADYLYGKVLSTDIRAHILVQIGEISRGLKLFSSGQSLCKHLGNSSLTRALYISEAIYKTRFGWETNLNTLQDAIEKLNPGDNYSHANLLLELARQQSIRGESDKAYESLDKASRFIYSNQNHRQEVALNLRYAYLMYLSGDYDRGLNALRSARRALHPEIDPVLELEVLDLEQRLALALGIKKENEVVNYLPKTRAGEDLIKDLMDLIREDPEQGMEAILKSKNFAFLYELLNINKKSSIMYLDLEPGSITLFHKGNVSHRVGLTPLLRKFLICLSDGVMEKEDLVSKVWGYKYDSLRHDSIVYSSMVALRKLLGEYSHWIITTESGYQWATGIEIKSLKKEKAVISNTAPSLEASSSMNFRQIKILQFLKKNESIDVQKCKKLFNVSDITASRDLSALTRYNSIARIGKGRAIQYVLADNDLVGGSL